MIETPFDQPEAYEQGDDRTQEDSLFEQVEALTEENKRLRSMLQELVVFGGAATDPENDDDDQKVALAILAGLIKQARKVLIVRGSPHEPH